MKAKLNFFFNYFYNSPLNSTQAIVLEYIEPDKLYHLITDVLLIKLYYNFTFDTNYSNFLAFWELNNCSYTFFNNNLNNSFKQSFLIEFVIIFEDNMGYIFAKKHLII